MKFGTSGKINFEEVLTASVAGMGYTIVTNALSNSKTIGPKWNANKDLNYSIGATALGAGLMFFLPKQKWTNAAGLGLIGAGGAIAAQVITGAIKPGGLNGFLGNALKRAAMFTPTGATVAGADQLKKLLNRNAACSNRTEKNYGYGARRINGVGPGSYGELAAFEALGYN